MANYIPAPEVDPSLSFQKFCERYQSDILKVCPGSTIEEDDSTFYILTPHRITAKELCVPTTFENSPVVVEYSPKLGALNPDYTDITLGQIIFDGAPCGTKEWRNAIQLSFFEEHKSALWQCGSFYLTIKKKKDATTDSGFRHVLLILFSGWDTANSLEALRGTEFSGLEVCPCRDEYEDCMAPQYQDPPLHEKIAMGSIFGDMTFSATFTLKKGSDKKKFSGKLYNLQCRHGFQSPKAPLKIDSVVFEPGPSFVKSTMWYYAEPTNHVHNQHGPAIHALLKNSVMPLVTGQGSSEDPKSFSNSHSRHLRAMKVGKLKIAMNQSDTVFIRLDVGPHHFGRSYGVPLNSFIPDGYPGRHYMLSDENSIPATRLTGLYTKTDLVDTYETIPVYQIGGITGFKSILIEDGFAHVQELHGMKDPGVDLSLWKLGSVHAYSARSQRNRMRGVPIPTDPNMPGDSSGPIFDRNGVLLGHIKGNWKSKVIGLFVPWYKVAEELASEDIEAKLAVSCPQ